MEYKTKMSKAHTQLPRTKVTKALHPNDKLILTHLINYSSMDNYTFSVGGVVAKMPYLSRQTVRASLRRLEIKKLITRKTVRTGVYKIEITIKSKQFWTVHHDILYRKRGLDLEATDLWYTIKLVNNIENINASDKQYAVWAVCGEGRYDRFNYLIDKLSEVKIIVFCDSKGAEEDAKSTSSSSGSVSGNITKVEIEEVPVDDIWGFYDNEEQVQTKKPTTSSVTSTGYTYTEGVSLEDIATTKSTRYYIDTFGDEYAGSREFVDSWENYCKVCCHGKITAEKVDKIYWDKFMGSSVKDVTRMLRNAIDNKCIDIYPLDYHKCG